MGQTLSAQVHPDNYSIEDVLEIERAFHQQNELVRAQEEPDLRLVP